MRETPCYLLLFGLCLFCSSCELGTPPKISAPPAPQPLTKPAPVVVPQTVTQLPEPHPVPPDSIPPRPAVEYQPPAKEVDNEADAPAEQKKPPQATKIPRQPKKTAAEPSATESATPSATAPPVEEPAAQPAAPPKLSTAAEASATKEQVNATLGEVRQLLKEIGSSPLTSNQPVVNRIRSFVRLAEQASARNDFRQGEILAHRALALARDVAVPK